MSCLGLKPPKNISYISITDIKSMNIGRHMDCLIQYRREVMVVQAVWFLKIFWILPNYFLALYRYYHPGHRIHSCTMCTISTSCGVLLPYGHREGIWQLLTQRLSSSYQVPISLKGMEWQMQINASPKDTSSTFGLLNLIQT